MTEKQTGTPHTLDELHEWIRTTLDVVIARRPLIPTHAAPFEYLAHAFFGAKEAHAPRDCVVWANRGGGKTFLGAIATALDLLFKPGIQIRILAGSLEQAGRMHAHLRAFFARPALAARVDGRITDRRLRLDNDSSVELLSQSHASVRGTRVQTLRCDEVELFDPRIWEAAQLVTRSARCGDFLVRGTVECLSTMHKPHGLMHELVEEARAGTRKLFKWGVVDVLGECDDGRECASPAGECALLAECAGRAKSRADAPGHIEIEDAIQMKSRVGLPVWESEMLCLRPSRTSSVVPEFDLRRHVVDELPIHLTVPGAARWVGGIDFGYRAPTVVLWGAVDAHGVLWIVDERVVSEVILDEHVRAIAEAEHPMCEWFGVDPAGGQRNDQTGLSDIQVLQRAGLRVRRRRLGVQEGLKLLRARLAPATGDPRLYLCRRCERLIESIERHHYPEDRPESLAPVKDGHDHAVDALRYLIVNLDAPTEATMSTYLR